MSTTITTHPPRKSFAQTSVQTLELRKIKSHEPYTPQAGPSSSSASKGFTQTRSSLEVTHEDPDLYDIDNEAAAVDTPQRQQQDEIYARFTPRRKMAITLVLSLCGFLTSIASTVVLSAIPEVAATYDTTGDVIGVSNALFLLGMGLSPCVCGPLARIWGRRWITVISAFLFTCFSFGSALAPTLVGYFVFRILTACVAMVFLIIGAACIGDIYIPQERGTALGWFLSGTLAGSAFGPFIGGVVVTFVNWRVIFWIQGGLSGLATIAVFFLLPETIHPGTKLSKDLEGLAPREKLRKLAQLTNPWRVIRLFQYKSIIAAGLGSSALNWNQFSLLTPIRYVLNPRFHLTSPIQSGLFFLAPGTGYLLGTVFGGMYADHIVKRYMSSRGGQRVPEDRLRSALPFLGVAVPASVLIYGWSVDRAVGGIPLVVIMMFLQGAAQMMCFPSLNAYCLDMMPDKSAEVIAGNYLIRFLFSAAGTAVCLPAIQAIGVGWFSTISTGFLIVAAVAVYLTIQRGAAWREAIIAKEQSKMMSKDAKARRVGKRT